MVVIAFLTSTINFFSYFEPFAPLSKVLYLSLCSSSRLMDSKVNYAQAFTFIFILTKPCFSACYPLTCFGSWNCLSKLIYLFFCEGLEAGREMMASSYLENLIWYILLKNKFSFESTRINFKYSFKNIY